MKQMKSTKTRKVEPTVLVLPTSTELLMESRVTFNRPSLVIGRDKRHKARSVRGGKHRNKGDE